MAMKKCSNCGMDVSDTVNVCPSCGNKLIEEIITEETPIICEDCGNELHHDAKVCPKCGCPVSEKNEVSDEVMQQNVENGPVNSTSTKKLTDEIMTKETPIICEDCGNEIPHDAKVCPKCGCPVKDKNEGAVEIEKQKVENVPTNSPNTKKFTKKHKIILVLIVLGIVSGLVINSIHTSKVKADYLENLKSASSMMFASAVQAEECGNLLKSVWYNTIYEEWDDETDKFTRSNGYGFNDDFNDSINALYADLEFQTKISSITFVQDEVTSLMKKLQNPPEEYEEAYDAIKEYYDAYIHFTDLVIDPSGSLRSFSEDFNEADTEVAECHKAMNLYIN